MKIMEKKTDLNSVMEISYLTLRTHLNNGVNWKTAGHFDYNGDNKRILHVNNQHSSVRK